MTIVRLYAAALILLCYSNALASFQPITDPGSIDCNVDNVFCAASCNRSDVLSACQDAEAYIAVNGVDVEGAIVKLPSCPDGPEQDWADSIEVSGGLRIIGSGRKGTQDETQLEILSGGRFFGFNYEADTRNAQVEVAHIYFKGYNETNGYQPDPILTIEDLQDALIHHCDLEDGKNTHIQFRATYGDEPYPSGVVWKCSIKRVHPSSKPSQYGVRVSHGPDYGAASPFPVTSMYLGMDNDLDTVVTVENCIFDDIYHPVAAFNGAHYVLRHSILSNTRAGVDMHGPSYSSDGRGRGTRAAEIYNNTFISSIGTAHIKPRSGGGILFNNSFGDGRYILWFQGEKGHRGRKRGPLAVGTTDCYQEGAPCDPGDADCYTFNNSSRIEDNSNPLSLACENTEQKSYRLDEPVTEEGFDIPMHWYIWANNIEDSMENGDEIRISDSGIENYVRMNKTYFLRAPSMADDGFNWEPYTYPHPLTMENPNNPDPPDNPAPENPPGDKGNGGDSPSSSCFLSSIVRKMDRDRF